MGYSRMALAMVARTCPIPPSGADIPAALADAWKTALGYQARIRPANIVGAPKVLHCPDDERTRVDLKSLDAMAR